MNWIKSNTLRIQVVLLSCLHVVWILGFIWVLFSQNDERGILLCIMGIYIVFNSVVISKLRHDVVSLRKHHGFIIRQQPSILSLFLAVLSGVFLGYFMYELINNNAQLSILLPAFVLTNLSITIKQTDLIIIEEHRIYMFHRWLMYDDIRKIDSDHSNKKYSVVYVFEKKMYSQRMEPQRYKEFEKIITQYYKHEYKGRGFK